MKTACDKLRSTALSAALIILPGMAFAQEACTTYTVKDGDTLGTIAQAAYGSYDYQNIFNANRDALAANPNTLPAGLQLILPCEDGRLTADAEVGAVIEEQTVAQEARPKSNIYEPPLKFVTSNNWAPFTGEELLGGGMFVRIGSTAMQRGGNDRGYEVSYVDDWMSHVDTLLPSGAFDMSVAWEGPDCTKLDILDEFSVRMCTEFEYSLPIYETVYTFTALSDNKYANARSFDELAGARICRPEAWSISELLTRGLADGVVTYLRPVDPMECANMVMNGEADIYSIESETASANFEELGATDKVTVNPALATFVTYHFITSKTNPRGRVYIAMLNRGITEMRESGEWYDIVATSLADFNKLSQ